MKIKTKFAMNKNKFFSLDASEFGLRTGAELGQHPTCSISNGHKNKNRKTTLLGRTF